MLSFLIRVTFVTAVIMFLLYMLPTGSLPPQVDNALSQFLIVVRYVHTDVMDLSELFHVLGIMIAAEVLLFTFNVANWISNKVFGG